MNSLRPILLGKDSARDDGQEAMDYPRRRGSFGNRTPIDFQAFLTVVKEIRGFWAALNQTPREMVGKRD